MASGKTKRRSLPFPLKTDPDTLVADIGSLAQALDNDAETGSVKKYSELPMAKTRGRQWQVTEDIEGVNGIYWDTGTNWIPISPGRVRVYGRISKTNAILGGSGNFTTSKGLGGVWRVGFATEEPTPYYAVVLTAHIKISEQGVIPFVEAESSYFTYQWHTLTGEEAHPEFSFIVI